MKIQIKNTMLLKGCDENAYIFYKQKITVSPQKTWY